jgi:hypothetical protein
MGQGVILISVRDGEFDGIEKDRQSYLLEKGDYKGRKRPFVPNPYRTGGWAVVTVDYLSRVVQNPETLALILRQHWSFIDDQTWNMLGLPRGDYPAKETK